MKIFVIDNNSDFEDFILLESGLMDDQVNLIKNETNTGFAGGHNLVIKQAIQDQADFVWVLNNDTTFQEDALHRLVSLAVSDDKIGAVSPVLVAAHDEKHIDFCGGMHDWNALNVIKLSNLHDAKKLQESNNENTWVSGAAMLLRVSAMSSVGLLDEGMFAYYEDNDISCRLVNAGWTNKVAFDCMVHHATSTDVYAQRPAYYFYLMARNSFLFWQRHTPAGYRRFLSLRLLDREILIANRLLHRGFSTKGNACLLGVYDGIMLRQGVPKLDRPFMAFWMKTLSHLLMINHAKHLVNKSDGQR